MDIDPLRRQKRFIGYVRNSTEMQRDNFSTEVQRQWCLKTARLYGFERDNIDIREEQATSGRTIDDRPIFKGILADVARGVVGVLAAIEVNRLTRDSDYIDGFVIYRACEEQDVLIVTKELVFDPRTPSHRDMFCIKLMGSRMQNESNLTALMNGLWQAAEEGRLDHGVVPFGYDRQPIPGSRKARSWLFPNEDEAQLVRWMHELIQTMGTQKIARRLNEQGYRFPVKSPGTQVHLGRQRGSAPVTERLWRGTDVLRILRSPRYKGLFVWGAKRRDSRYYRDRKEPVSCVLPHLKIVDEARWQATNARLDGRNRAVMPPRAATSPYIFSGLIKCTTCGGPMKGGRKRRTDPSRRYRFYRCATEADLSTCKGSSVHGRIVAEAVKADLLRSLPNLNLEQLLDEVIDDRLQLDVDDQTIRTLDAQIAALAVERQRALALYMREQLTDTEIDRELKRITEVSNRLESQRRQAGVRHRHRVTANELRSYVGEDLAVWIRLLRGQRLANVARLVYRQFEIKASGNGVRRHGRVVKARYKDDFVTVLARLRSKRGKEDRASTGNLPILTRSNH